MHAGGRVMKGPVRFCCVKYKKVLTTIDRCAIIRYCVKMDNYALLFYLETYSRLRILQGV